MNLGGFRPLEARPSRGKRRTTSQRERTVAGELEWALVGPLRSHLGGVDLGNAYAYIRSPRERYVYVGSESAESLRVFCVDAALTAVK